MARPALLSLVVALALGCGAEATTDAGAARDAGGGMDAGPLPPRDAAATRLPDAAPGSDGGPDAALDDAAPDPSDGAPSLDGSATDDLAAERLRLLATLGEPCAVWADLEHSARMVFLTLSHRMHLSRLADGTTMLGHLTRVYAILGGGPDGSECGGGDNNRLFLQMDETLHRAMVDTWDGTETIGDGGGLLWVRTRDLAGPHDPFDASDETDSGLRCAAFLIETSDSRPPTAQAHFFTAPDQAAPVERGPTSLPSDPRMLEIDHDFDCLHRSNPTCNDFEARYLEHYGEFDRDWAPSGCAP